MYQSWLRLERCPLSFSQRARKLLGAIARRATATKRIGRQWQAVACTTGQSLACLIRRLARRAWDSADPGSGGCNEHTACNKRWSRRMAGHVHGSDAWLSDVLHPILQFQSLAGSPQLRRQQKAVGAVWYFGYDVAASTVGRQTWWSGKDAKTRGREDAGAVEEWWPSKGKSRRTSSARKRAGHSSHHSMGKLSAIRHCQSLSAPLPSALCPPLPSLVWWTWQSINYSQIASSAEHLCRSCAATVLCLALLCCRLTLAELCIAERACA